MRATDRAYGQSISIHVDVEDTTDANFETTYIHEIQKIVGAGQAVVIGHKHVLQNYVAVLDDPQRHLVPDGADLQAGAPSVHNEPVDLVVDSVLSEHYEHVCEAAVRRPALLAIEDPPSRDLTREKEIITAHFHSFLGTQHVSIAVTYCHGRGN